MKISRRDTYKSELQEILKFIANDKISASKQFKKELDIADDSVDTILTTVGEEAHKKF